MLSAGHTFTTAVKLILNAGLSNMNYPVKMLTAERLLYFDPDIFRNFIQGKIDMPELIEQTACDALAFNKCSFEITPGRTIAKGTLFKRIGQYYYLADGSGYAGSVHLEKSSSSTGIFIDF